MKAVKTIKVKYFGDVEKLKSIENGDWIDLRAAKDVELKPFEEALIPLGVAMRLPDGYEAHIVPRSSTYKKWNIIQTNHMGVIDNSYSGNNDQWMMPVKFIPSYKDFWRDIGDANNKDLLPVSVIKRGDRICQFRIVENQPNVDIVEVDDLGKNNRGGFGSTGRA